MLIAWREDGFELHIVRAGRQCYIARKDRADAQIKT
jgi:hypothetical protein